MLGSAHFAHVANETHLSTQWQVNELADLIWAPEVLTMSPLTLPDI